ncbi:MAG: nucleotide sugar dehydrogenase [Gemmatimonadetes bacterium]|nr:nucleotide sugar dehydrogenase [Gemmatimonadota bacterium]
MQQSTPAALASFVERVNRGEAVIGVMGLGYVGLPLALEMAGAGYRVIGFDVSAAVVAGINAGRSHIQDVTTAELAPLVEAGRLEATSDMSRLAECDAVSICVPTPLSKTRDPDVSYVVAATAAVAAALRAGQLIILESTTYPGTTREVVLPALEAQGLRVGEDVFLCFSPERVDPGNAQWQIHNTPKVIGGITAACTEAGSLLYGRILERVIVVSSTEAAELTKLLENTFRAVNIALVNEMAQVADRLDVDVFEVIEAAATKPFGFMRFNPGPGIGGHCIPLDPHYLAWKMRTLNYKTRLIDLAGEVNSEMPHFVVNKVQDVLNARRRSLNGSRILVAGVAYKRDVDDVRESPALDIMRLLEAKGAHVLYHDPHVPRIDEDGLTRRSVALSDPVARACDAIVIVTDHTAMDYEGLAAAGVPVVDTRNVMKGHSAGHIIPLSGSARMVKAEAPGARAEPAQGRTG